MGRPALAPSARSGTKRASASAGPSRFSWRVRTGTSHT